MSFHEVRPYLGDQWVGPGQLPDVVTDDAFRSRHLAHRRPGGRAPTVGSLLLGLVLALLLEGTGPAPVVRPDRGLPADGRRDGGGRRGLADHLLPGRRTASLNSILGWVGIGPVAVPQLARTPRCGSVMAVGIWRGAPYDMMIFLAGLAGVDRTLYEAAAVDGASTVPPALARHLPGAAAGLRDPAHPGGDPRAARLHRGLPAHQRRAERLHRGADDADLQARPGTQANSASPRPDRWCCWSPRSCSPSRSRPSGGEEAPMNDPHATRFDSGARPQRVCAARWRRAGASRCSTRSSSFDLRRAAGGAAGRRVQPGRRPDQLTLIAGPAHPGQLPPGRVDRGVCGTCSTRSSWSASGCCLQILVSISAAYALARKQVPGGAAGACC